MGLFLSFLITTPTKEFGMIALAKQPKPAVCMVPNCGRDAGKSRGICTSCYATAKRMIDMKQTTWAELESAGLCRPFTGRGHGNSPMRLALEYVKQCRTVEDAKGASKQEGRKAAGTNRKAKSKR